MKDLTQYFAEVIDTTFSEDCVSRQPLIEAELQLKGRDEFKSKFVQPLLNAFPDLVYVSHEVVVDLPTIINRWTFR